MVKKNNFIESLNLFNNKSGKKSYNGILIIAGILGVMFLVGLVVGYPTADRSHGNLDPVMINVSFNASGTFVDNKTINEDADTRINISVLLLDARVEGFESNITEINITLPSWINYTLYSNYTDNFPLTWLLFNVTNRTTDRNNQNNLSINTSDSIPLLRNISGQTNQSYISFNITGYVPGSYLINVTLRNATTQSIGSSLNITVLDVTAPSNVTAHSNSTGLTSVTPVYRAYPTTRANVSQSWINLSVFARDFSEFGAGGHYYGGQEVGNVNMSLYYENSTSVLNSTMGKYHAKTFGNLTNESFSVNWFSLSDGNYRINISTVNDSKGNTNYTGLSYNLTIDTVNPTVTVAKSATSTAHQIVLDLTLSDATSGINGKQCTVTGGGTGSITMSGTTGSQTATQAGLSCNSANTYTVACTDHAGNTNSQSVTVNTDGCTGGSGGTGSGGSGDVVGSASSEFWILTYNEASTDLSDDPDGVSSNLAERYRVKIKVDTKLYYVGVVETTDTTARINVTTTAEDKEATLSVGDVKKFDVNADDKYDISVTLNGVDSATGKADLSVIYVQEPVSAEDREAVEEQVGEEATTPTTAKSKAWIWIVVVLAVIVIVGAIFYSKKKTRFKNYGF